MRRTVHGTRWAALALAGAMALASCDDDGPGIEPGGLEITLAPLSLTILPGGTGEVQVNVIRSGTFDAAVAISASGLPPGVTAGSLEVGPTDDEGTLTLVATQAAAGSAATVTVTATGGGEQAEADLALTVSTGLVTELPDR